MDGMSLRPPGIGVVNHHRPLSVYNAVLQTGMILNYFDDPSPVAGAPEPKADRYRRAPWFVVMEWRKAAAR
jgi:hypothetical protein